MIEPKQTLYYEMDYDEVQRLIRDHFGFPDFSIVACEEWSNDSFHAYSIWPKNYSDQDREEVKLFIASQGKQQYCLGELLCELADNSILPWGEYLISVCW